MTPPDSPRLRYRRATAEDAGFLADLATEKAVRSFIGGLPLPDGPSSETLFILERGGLPVGWGGFVPSRAFNGHDMELVCIIAPAGRCDGLATEACDTLVHWALEERGWRRVLALVDDANTPGLGLATKSHFTEIGRLESDAAVRILERVKDAG